MSTATTDAMIPDDTRRLVHQAISLLSARCDGAHDLDGQGFSGIHAPFGNAIAALPVEAWNDEMVRAAADLLPIYKRQLAGAGFDVTQVPALPDAGTVRKSKSLVRAVTIQDGEFALHFGFDEVLLSDVKASFRSRRWDRPSKTWRVPTSCADQMQVFVERAGFTMSDEARAVMDGEATAEPVLVSRGRVWLVEDDLIGLEFPFDRQMRAETSQWPGRHWNAEHRRWEVHPWLAPKVVAFATKWRLDVDDAVLALPMDGLVPVSIDLDDTELVVRFPFAERATQMMRMTGYARFRHRVEGWIVPVARMRDLMATIEANPHVKIASDVTRIEAAIADADLAREWAVTDEDVPPLCDLGVELAGWQWAGVRYALKRRATFLSAPVGLGKTRVALATIKAADAFPVAIFVPPTLVVNWIRETVAAMPDKQVAIMAGQTARGWGMLQPDIVIGGYDTAHHWKKVLVHELRPVGLVVDESHAAKEWSTQRSKAFHFISKGLSGEHAGQLRLNLTATPVLNHRKEYSSQIEILGRLDEFGGKVAVERMPDIADRLRASWAMWRPTKEKIMPHLPKERHLPVMIAGDDLDAKIMAEYRYAEAEFLNYLGEKAAAMAAAAGKDPFEASMEAKMRASGAEHLVQIGHLKRLAARAKMPAVKRWVDEFHLAEPKLLIFGASVQLLDELAVQYSCPVIRGASNQAQGAEVAVSSGERMKVVDTFQSDENLHDVVLSLMAGGVGLTLTAASNVAFVEMGWTPGIHDQAIGRCYGRMNDPHGAAGWYMIAEGTIDEKIVNLLDDKRREVDQATDGIDPDDRPEGSTSILGDLIVSMYRKALGREDG